MLSPQVMFRSRQRVVTFLEALHPHVKHHTAYLDALGHLSVTQRRKPCRLYPPWTWTSMPSLHIHPSVRQRSGLRPIALLVHTTLKTKIFSALRVSRPRHRHRLLGSALSLLHFARFRLYRQLHWHLLSRTPLRLHLPTSYHIQRRAEGTYFVVHPDTRGCKHLPRRMSRTPRLHRSPRRPHRSNRHHAQSCRSTAPHQRSRAYESGEATKHCHLRFLLSLLGCSAWFREVPRKTSVQTLHRLGYRARGRRAAQINEQLEAEPPISRGIATPYPLQSCLIARIPLELGNSGRHDN
jgi:hypothetical protein